MGEKYQIDGPRPWFSRLCTQCAFEKPWDALFLACNASPMDTEIIRQAIRGFPIVGRDKICEPRYFKETKSATDGSRCWSTIHTTNIKPELGFKLGLPGLLAYGDTFATIRNGCGTTWQTYAEDFIDNAKAVEEARDVVSSEQLFDRGRHP
jgi:hypothetical protein